MQAYGVDQSSRVLYAIAREEKLNADGVYQIITSSADFTYRVDRQSGLIEQIMPQFNASSILVVIQVTDASDLTSQTECKLQLDSY